MAPKMFNSLTEVGREDIANAYFHSLGTPETRKNHTLLAPKIAIAGGGPPLSVHDVEMDFTSWYGGFRGLAWLIGESVELPAIQEMCKFVTQDPQRYKQALAA